MSNKWNSGKVQWFDHSSGEGMILCDSGDYLYVHYSSIVNPKERTPTLSTKKRKNLESGKSVKFTIYENFYSKSIEKVKQV